MRRKQEFLSRVGLPKTITEQGGPGPSTIKVSDYLVGPQLDGALAAGPDPIISSTDFGLDTGGGDTVTSPFSFLASTLFFTRCSIRKRVLFITLSLRRTKMESPAQLSTFPGPPLSSCERICKMPSERLNAAGFSILERPMAQMYFNTLDGLTIDLGYHRTGVSAVSDGFLLTRVGECSCQN